MIEAQVSERRGTDAGCSRSGRAQRPGELGQNPHLMVPYITRGIPTYDLLKTAPTRFTQHARNPKNSVEIGDVAEVFAASYGSPFVMDLDKGRRYGTIEDFRNFVKLAQSSPWLHHSGGTICEPTDIAVNKCHFDMVYSHFKYSDRAYLGSITAPERAEDRIEMSRILFCAGFVNQNCVVMGNFSTSKLPDAQAMQQSMMSMMSAMQCGANYVLHSAGFLDGLLSMSYEKIMLDTDVCGALHAYLNGVQVNDDTLGFEALAEQGPGEHLFSTAHTMLHYKTAYYDSALDDNQPWETWDEQGVIDMVTRAHKRWKKPLAEYEVPALDQSIDEALRDFMVCKNESMADTWH